MDQYSKYLDEKHPLHILETSKDPYVCGIAVILSGNCTDAAVNKMLPNFLSKFPTPSSVVHSNRDEMIPFMPGINHSGSKSDYIINWAKYIIEQNGLIEADLDKLTKINGIGRKTGSIILYRVLGVDQGFPLDTHCLRVLNRLGWYKSSKPKGLEKELLVNFPEGSRHNNHIILTHFGRDICHPQNPQCEICKLSAHCHYYLKEHEPTS